MGEFKFSCPHCDQHILCDEQSSGREIQCPACQHRLQIPPAPGKSARYSLESERTAHVPPQRPPDAWLPQPLAVQPSTLQIKHNSPSRWKVSPVILASLAVGVTGILLLWSVQALRHLHFREAALLHAQGEITAKRQDEFYAKRQKLWQAYQKQSALEAASFQKQLELRLQQGLEKNRQREKQRLQRNERQTQLTKEQTKLVLGLAKLPHNSSEYRVAINRLQGMRAELGAIEKMEGAELVAELRQTEMVFKVMDLEHKLFETPRRARDYLETSNQLLAARTELRRLMGETPEESLWEAAAGAWDTASSSNLLRQLNALTAVGAEPEQPQQQLANTSLLATRYTLTLVVGAAFAVSVSGLAYALRYRRKRDDYRCSTELANENDLSPSVDLVKLDPDTTLENFLLGGAMGGVLFVLGIGKVALVGHRSSPPNPELLPLAVWALPLCLACFIALCFTDNYYLLDRERHQILYHFKFLWFRRLRVFLQRKDVVGVAVQGRKNGQRGQRSYWEYRIGVVGATGRWVALTEWQKEPLEPCNTEASKLATMLGCQAYPASTGCELVVRREGARVSIAYVPLWHGLTRGERWLCLIVGLMVLGAFLYVGLSI